MPVSLSEALALLRAAIEADFPGFNPRGLTVLSGDDYPAISLPLLPGAMPPRTSSDEKRPYSHTEQAILRALTGARGSWMTGQQIADACGLPRSGAFNALLSNLAEAGVLESSTRSGYRLPQSQPS